MRTKNIAAILVILLAVLLAGCSGGSPSSDTSGTNPGTNSYATSTSYSTSTTPLPVASSTVPRVTVIETVQVVRTSDNPHSTLAPFNHMGQNASTVQALFNGLLALPKYVPGQVTCPSDIGVEYKLTFSHGSSVVMSAVADPSGCQIVVVNGRDNRTAANSQLWTLLANAVGVPPTLVYPVTSS